MHQQQDDVLPHASLPSHNAQPSQAAQPAPSSRPPSSPAAGAAAVTALAALAVGAGINPEVSWDNVVQQLDLVQREAWAAVAVVKGVQSGEFPAAALVAMTERVSGRSGVVHEVGQSAVDILRGTAPVTPGIPHGELLAELRRILATSREEMAWLDAQLVALQTGHASSLVPLIECRLREWRSQLQDGLSYCLQRLAPALAQG